MTENKDEIEVEDDALEMAAGGIQSPSSGSAGYSYNSTVYFQVTINDKVT